MVSKVKVDAIESTTGSGTIALNNQFSGMTASSMPTGSVLQVVSSTFVSAATGTTIWTSPTLISDLSVSITPTSSTNKIWISVTVHLASAGNDSTNGMLYKDGSILTAAHQSSYGSRIRSFVTTGYFSASDLSTHGQHTLKATSGAYLDTAGGTSAITYALYVGARTSNWYVNRTRDDGDGGYSNRTTSSITAMEIKG